MGTVLGVAFAVRSRAVGARFLAGATLPVLVCTTYFTFGRAAVLALPLGLVAMLAVDPRRLQALAGALVARPPAGVGRLARLARGGIDASGG